MVWEGPGGGMGGMGGARGWYGRGQGEPGGGMGGEGVITPPPLLLRHGLHISSKNGLKSTR